MDEIESTQVDDGTVVLGNGISVVTNARHVRPLVDWQGIRTLCEAGVSIAQVARLFKVSRPTVSSAARQQNWLIPSNIDRMRREVAKRAAEMYRRKGEVPDLVKVRAEVWDERGEAVREKAFQIADMALTEAVKKKKGKKLVNNSSDLLNVVKIAREATGLTQKEAQAQAPLAVNLSFLRSAPEQVIDV